MLIRPAFNLQFLHLTAHFAPCEAMHSFPNDTWHCTLHTCNRPSSGCKGGARHAVRGLGAGGELSRCKSKAWTGAQQRASRPKIQPGVPAQGNRDKAGGVNIRGTAAWEASGRAAAVGAELADKAHHRVNTMGCEAWCDPGKPSTSIHAWLPARCSRSSVTGCLEKPKQTCICLEQSLSSLSFPLGMLFLIVKAQARIPSFAWNCLNFLFKTKIFVIGFPPQN